MVFLIKINRDTIRKNPSAGERVYRIVGPELSIEETKISKEGDWWFKRNYVGGILIAEEGIKQDARPSIWPSGDVEITRRQNIQTMYSLEGQPAYFFEYEPTSVQCEDCGEKFLHTQLALYENDAYDDYAYTVTGCPKCFGWDCCDLKYEALTQEIIDAHCNR